MLPKSNFMKIKIINNGFSFKRWEKLVNHPLQSFLFSEARRRMGIKILRWGEFENEKLINVFQMSLHSLPFGYQIGYLPRSIFPSLDSLKFLANYGKENKIIFIKIEPYIFKKTMESIDIPSVFKLKKSTHPLFPNWTQMLDLRKSEEELMKKFHHKTRYNIRLAQRKGVVVKELTDEKGFDIFSKLYFETCKRQHYHGHNLRYHRILWEFFKKRIAHIFIAFYQKIPLAAYQVWLYKNRAYYTYGGSSERYRNLMASNLLMWEVIRWAKRNGARWFDLWGSLPPNYSPSHPWAGFTRFKQGYGTEFVELVGSFDLVIDPIFYYLYNLIYPIRQLFLKFV